MRIKFGRKIEKLIKSTIERARIRNKDFTIISNNCWGTFIYKKFGLPYQSPFINMYIFAPDYIDLLENFSPEILQNMTFIEHNESKYKEYLSLRNPQNVFYPIGVLGGKYEVHFLHYDSELEAKQKWGSRLKRINYEKLIFKFSDANMFEDSMAERFEKLKFKNKISFTARKYENLKSTIALKKFENSENVDDEWKHSAKEFNVVKYINEL